MHDGDVKDIVSGILTDVFLNFSIAPGCFQTSPEIQQLQENLLLQREILQCTINSIGRDTPAAEEKRQNLIAEQNLLTQEFVNHPAVRQAYLNDLKRQGNYLLQTELELLAIYLNKKVILLQPTWGSTGEDEITSNTLNPNGEGEHHVYYNGTNHYEKASIV